VAVVVWTFTTAFSSFFFPTLLTWTHGSLIFMLLLEVGFVTSSQSPPSLFRWMDLMRMTLNIYTPAASSPSATWLYLLFFLEQVDILIGLKRHCEVSENKIYLFPQQHCSSSSSRANCLFWVYIFSPPFPTHTKYIMMMYFYFSLSLSLSSISFLEVQSEI
jgi:hypothetical protein